MRVVCACLRGDVSRQRDLADEQGEEVLQVPDQARTMDNAHSCDVVS
jgi:hypothetical protein